MGHLNGSRRGTMLLVVLGLLVALFVIGTSFSYITLAERKASTNYLDRQRALDLAFDGVEYSIARLRAEATRRHYEEISDQAFEYDFDKKDIDGAFFATKNLDSRDVRVSWNKGTTNTSNGKDTPDGAWIDFNNNGIIDGNETSFGGSKMPNGRLAPGTRSFLSGVTLFHNEGIRIDTVPRDQRPYDNEKNWGASGTYEDMGDYTRVKVIDAASQLNLNNFKGARLEEVLTVLGYEIDKWVSGGKAAGKNNPFLPEIAKAIVKVHDECGNFFTNKEQLRPIYDGTNGAVPRLYDLAMNFVTVNNWRDPSYRDYSDNAGKIDENKQNNPLGLTDMEIKRSGHIAPGGGGIGGKDGWPDHQPDPAVFTRAPININTAPKPVLVTLFAGLEAKARLLYFKKANQISENDRLYQDLFGAAPNRLVFGTPDLGRQNNALNYTNLNESTLQPGGDSSAIFQLLPIGPITSGAPSNSTSAGGQSGQDYASELAELVLQLRKQHAFTSWQDFDTRFCYQQLLGMPVQQREKIKVGDVVNAQRSSMLDSGTVAGIPPRLLPLADNCKHAANPLTSTDAAMSQTAFRAWYWKCVVDMLRAALNPNNVVNRYNADYPYHQNVDRMDLTKVTCPICFSSMGIYEVVSQGEILAPTARGVANLDTGTSAGGVAQMRTPVARRQVRTLVEIYTVMRHTSQYDFMQALDPDVANNSATTTGTAASRNVAALTRFQTCSWPFSADEKEAGAWNDVSTSDTSVYGEDATYMGVTRKGGYNPVASLSRDFGFITQRPQDRTPIQGMQTGLTFWSRFNEGLDSRTGTAAGVFGLNSSPDTFNGYGNKPLDRDVVFDDFVNTATPRRVDPAFTGGVNEFTNADKGDEATRYATLIPDGVFLRGSAIREKYRAPAALQTSYGTRGSSRFARLKLLRYPNGSNVPNHPFDPIEKGMDRDSMQQLPGAGITEIRRRLIGDQSGSVNFSGKDDHNQAMQNLRQTRANCPYYEGTLDFWIKWDFPAQGNDGLGTSNPVTVCMGEIDPASHNFSGLFGATAFGRMTSTASSGAPFAGDPERGNQAYSPANSQWRSGNGNNAVNADMEGVQFYIFKEPGGFLRFTRLYFSEAFAQDFPQGVGYAGGNVAQFGLAMRRIIDESDTMGVNQYTGTNDICPKNDANDLGFKYARTDGWVNLSALPSTIPCLRVHDWHRITLSYNSSSVDQPYDLWIDGRKVAVEFHPDNDPNQPKGFINDGSHTPFDDQDVPLDDAQEREVLFRRTTSKLLEINPEDRLTIGCLFRRQLDISQQAMYDLYYKEDPDTATTAPTRPVFKFDANLIAVANATIDDMRISSTKIQPSYSVNSTDYANASRYLQNGGIATQNPTSFFEQGFLPFNPNASGSLLTAPVRLGTLSWTEYRPDFDPYNGQGININKSARLIIQWGIFADIRQVRQSNGMINFSDAKVTGTIDDPVGTGVTDNNYWALGGLSLKGNRLAAGETTGVLVYRVHFISPDPMAVPVANVSAVLDDVTLTVMTPPRKLAFVIEY